MNKHFLKIEQNKALKHNNTSFFQISPLKEYQSDTRNQTKNENRKEGKISSKLP
ncbi:MAG: hypothetical protein ACI8P3_001289 [Saprospiraceae bacterium]|jgi:hypothetical protein